MKFYLGAYLKEQRHIFGVCPNPDCGQVSRLAEIEVSYRSKYVLDWLDEIEKKQAEWDQKIEGLLALQKDLKERWKSQAERRILPQKLKRIAPAFTKMRVNPRDVRVISHPIDFVAFDGISQDSLRRIVLLDSKRNDGSRTAIQESIEATIDKERYDWGILRIDNDGYVKRE